MGAWVSGRERICEYVNKKKTFPPAPPLGDVRHPLIGESDKINHPEHYTHGAVESIDLIESLGHGKGFCYGSVLKYLYRAEHKGDEAENLKKAAWYINRRLRQIESDQ